MKNWLKSWWFIIAGAVLLCGSGVIPAIIPQAVPAANKTGNATKFQLASGAFTNGDYLKYDANGNAIDGGIPGGAAWGSITGNLPDQTDLEIALDSRTGDKRLTNYYAVTQNLGNQPFKNSSFQTVTWSTGQDQPHSLFYVNDYLYSGTNTQPGILVKTSAADITVRTSVSFTADGFHDYASDAVYVPSRDKIYIVWGSNTRTTVSEINPSTLAWTDVISDVAQPTSTSNGFSGGWSGQSLTSDGTYLYILTTTSPSKVLKYKFSDWSKTTATLTSRNKGHCIRYDGTYLWASGADSPGWLARVLPSTLAFVSTVFATGDNIATDDLAFTDTDVYVGLETTNGIIIRQDRDFQDYSYRIYTGMANLCFGVYYDGRYLWALYDTSAGVIRMDPTNFEIVQMRPVQSLHLANINEMAWDGAGRVWMTSSSYGAPGILTRPGLGVPAGYTLHRYIASIQAHGTSGNTTPLFDLDYLTGQAAFGGHQQYTGTAPAINPVDTTGCGLGSALDANATDTTGTITLAGTPGTCVITFKSTFTDIPHCTVTLWEGGLVPLVYTPAATTLTIAVTGLTGHIDYRCTR